MRTIKKKIYICLVLVKQSLEGGEGPFSNDGGRRTTRRRWRNTTAGGGVAGKNGGRLWESESERERVFVGERE